MKKLLFTALIILASFVATAQKSFVKKYTYFIEVKNNVAGEWKQGDVTIVFNENNTSDATFYYSNKTLSFYRVSNVEEGETKAKEKYQITTYIDKSDGTQMRLQLFNDSSLRVFTGDETYLEFR